LQTFLSYRRLVLGTSLVLAVLAGGGRAARSQTVVGGADGGLSAIAFSVAPDGGIPPGARGATSTVNSLLPNKVRVADLQLRPPLATMGEDVDVATTITNETEGLLSNVGWELVLAEGVTRSGSIGLIPPHGRAVIETSFPASRIGEQDVTITVDPAARLAEAPRERSDNQMRTKVVVVKPNGDAWTTFARGTAALARPLLAVMKKDVCVVGSITGPSLTIRMLDVRSFDLSAMASVLTDKGIDESLANAVTLAVSGGFRAWAAEYRSVHPAAFPTFTRVTGPVAPATRATFSLPPNTSPKGPQVITPDELDKTLTARIGARANEPGAKSAIRALAASFSAQLTAWAMTQPVEVKGSGRVNGASGPVEGGTLTIPKTGPCGHLP
jgi:hypothetical protein